MRHLKLEGIEEEVLTGILGYSEQYFDKALDDHILFWCLKIWIYFLYLGHNQLVHRFGVLV